ncbi:MAG TPA: 3-oxoacyl-[acyl-carrier-protein] synthase III C-terminal domain-containing protein [Polyangiaceae bacterium]|nr:3-oxoacyl-[acyl-carrier-protein] synthase III C-terminal domain-containing protein [Polyangiaceae bacterium]
MPTETAPPLSLQAVASYLPERVVANDFFASGTSERRGMFTAPSTRRHVRGDESAVDMIEKAARRLIDQEQIDPATEIDLLFTNVAIPDQAFTGCGAEVAARIGARPRWIVDLHNSGCVSFVYMLDLARTLFAGSNARSALLCCVQNAGGRLFSQAGVRALSQAPIPGDGCGVGYVKANGHSPLLSLVQHCQPEFAADMSAIGNDGRRYWEPGTSPISIAFSDARVAAIIERGNSLVPELVRLACRNAGVEVRNLDLLVTNQPSPIFLRNWGEALELAPGVHHHTFARLGNLFGAAIPINLEDALASSRLRPGSLLCLAGFSHAGDYGAAAVLRWQGPCPADP